MGDSVGGYYKRFRLWPLVRFKVQGLGFNTLRMCIFLEAEHLFRGCEDRESGPKP